MTKKRYEQIKNEAERRLLLWLEHSTLDEMSCYGSQVRFHMSLGLLGGYPFKKEMWMKKFTGFITEKEFYSPQYEEITDSLYKKYNTLGRSYKTQKTK